MLRTGLRCCPYSGLHSPGHFTTSTRHRRLIPCSPRLGLAPNNSWLSGNQHLLSLHTRHDPYGAHSKAKLYHRATTSAQSYVLVFALGVMATSTCAVLFWKRPQEERQALLRSTLPLAHSPTPLFFNDTKSIQQVRDELEKIVGKGNVATSEHDINAHAGSEWSSYDEKESERSLAVVYPCDTNEVSQIMALCHAQRIPVTAYSGGTSLEGHLAPTMGGICIDFSRMGRILAVHEADLDVVVEPGVGWEELNEELSTYGLFFPPDPGPGAKIGGMVGTGCSGTNAYRYGTMRDWVLSLTVVLADGTVIKTRQRPRKSSAGYDLTRLFIGSEGTLGLVTEATLKVMVRPEKSSVAVATFPSLYDAARCVSKLVASGVPVAGMELLDDAQMRFINKSGVTGRKWAESSSLFFRFSGTNSSIKEQIGLVKAAAEQSSSETFDFAVDSEEAAELWSARKEALWSVLASKKNSTDRVWTTDVAVPISRLCDIIQETKEDITRSGLSGGIVGHVGDGNFHAMILFNEAERHVAEQVIHRMVVRAIEMEGTVTGEHGVGLIKRDYLPKELGQPTVDAMRIIKRALDPQCLLNCNKIFPMSDKGAS